MENNKSKLNLFIFSKFRYINLYVNKIDTPLEYNLNDTLYDIWVHSYKKKGKKKKKKKEEECT